MPNYSDSYIRPQQGHLFLLGWGIFSSKVDIFILPLTDGRKLVMGVRIGSTENAQVCRDLLTDLLERGLQYNDGILAIIGGPKALRRALKDVFGQKY
jgi:putative transposase